MCNKIAIHYYNPHAIFRNVNLVQNMVEMLDKHVTHLGDIVEEKSTELQEGKKQTEILLKRILPRYMHSEVILCIKFQN